MSSVLKSYNDLDVQADKRVVEDSFQLMDDQLRWIEQKLSVQVDNAIVQQFIQCQNEIKELEKKLEDWKR